MQQGIQITDTTLSESELNELLELFRLVDLDHGGTISVTELENLMRTLGIRSSKVELETMINEIDIEGTGEISFKSFVRAMSRKIQTRVKPKELEKAFRRFQPAEDHNNNTIISMSTMVSILSECGTKEKRLTRDEAEDLIASIAPQAKSGSFDYGALLSMF